ncbi:Conotoxin AbVIE [Dirofilaria immitis]
MSGKFGTLTQRLVHPTAPVLLTKNGPLGSFAPIPKSDDRFARQNRFGLPPEFPLASSCSERICWDPKDGELYLSRMKPEETLVEVRSDSDVQIDRLTLV